MANKIKPLIELKPGESLTTTDTCHIIEADHSFEEVLHHILHKEMGGETMEDRRSELVAILLSMDLGGEEEDPGALFASRVTTLIRMDDDLAVSQTIGILTMLSTELAMRALEDD